MSTLYLDQAGEQKQHQDHRNKQLMFCHRCTFSEALSVILAMTVDAKLNHHNVVLLHKMLY